MAEKQDAAAQGGQARDVLAALKGRLLEDTLRYIPSAIVPALLSIAGISIFTRIFAPGDYGRYALVMAAVTFIAVLMSAWIQQSVLRYFPRYEAEGRGGEFGTKLFAVLKVVSWLFLIVALAIWFLVRGRMDGYAGFFLPAAALVVLEAVFTTLNSAMQAKMASQAATNFKVARAFLRLGFALLLVFAIDEDVVYLVVGAGAANLLLVIPMLAGLGISPDPGIPVRSLDRAFIRMFLVYGVPMVGWMLCGQVLALSDRFIIGAFRGSGEVGIYSASYNLVSMGFGLISTPFLTACYPIVMNAWERGEKGRIEEIIGLFSRYYLIVVLPVVVFIAAYSREIVSILLGGAFREGYAVVPMVLGGVVLWGLAMVGHKGLEIAERTGVLLRLVGITSLVNIVLNLIFVPRYGYLAAAATTLASYALYPVLVFHATKAVIPWRIRWRSLARTLAAGAGALGFSLRFESLLDGKIPDASILVVGFAAALAVYFGILLLAGEFERRAAG